MKSRHSFLVLLFAVLCLPALSGRPQLGLQTWTLRNLSFEDAVLFAAAHGITQLELYAQHLDPNAPREVNLRKLDFLHRHGVTAYSIGVCPTTTDKEKNRPLFELAKLFGMKVIIVEPGDPAQWDNLEELVREYDIKLAIHNHGTGTVYANPATVKAVLAKRDPRIGVCLDLGWVTAAGFDAETVFRNYLGRVFDLHFKDKRLDQKDEKGRPIDTLIGLGNVNYAGLFAALCATHWSGVMAIETDSDAFAKAPDEFVTQAKQFFEQSARD